MAHIRFLKLGGIAAVALGLAALIPFTALAGSWSDAVLPQNPSAGGYLLGISCVSSSSCVAVGAVGNYGAGPYQPLAETWDGTSWNDTALPISVGTGDNELLSVSCVSANMCVAVGAYTNGSGTFQTLAETWDGSAWNDSALPLNVGTADNALGSISCVSSTMCVAVGTYINGSGVRQTLAETWNGSSWNDSPLPLNVGSGDNSFATSRSDPGIVSGSVSCVSATMCIAVGSYTNGSGVDQTLAETWNGSTWNDASLPQNPSTSGDILSGVSCISATACVAVGGAASGGVENTLSETWNGSTWSDTAQPQNPGTYNVLNSISCVSFTSCVASGFDLSGSGSSRIFQTLAETWNGSAWSDNPLPQNISPTEDGLIGISCVPSNMCISVGGYTNDSGVHWGTLGEIYSVSPATITLTSSNNTSTSGQNITLTASVTGSGATGTIDFEVDGVSINGCSAVPISNGTATCTTSFTSSATPYSLTALYDGDVNYATSTSTTLLQTVNPILVPATGNPIARMLLGVGIIIVLSGMLLFVIANKRRRLTF